MQRIGRTGRKKDGAIAVLVAEGREEDNFSKAKASYAAVQNAIVSGDQIELYGDVERLIPPEIKPTVVEKVMTIQPYMKEVKETKATKRKRSEGDGPISAPPGAKEGFVSVADMMKGAAAKSKAKPAGRAKKLPKRDKILTDSDDDVPDGETILADILQTGKKKTRSPPSANSSSEEEAPARKKVKSKAKVVPKPSSSSRASSAPKSGPIGFRSAKDVYAEKQTEASSSEASDSAPVVPPSPPKKKKKKAKKTAVPTSASPPPRSTKRPTAHVSSPELGSTSKAKGKRKAVVEEEEEEIVAPRASPIVSRKSPKSPKPPPQPSPDWPTQDDGAWLLNSDSDEEVPISVPISTRNEKSSMSSAGAGPSRLATHHAASPAIQRTSKPLKQSPFVNRLITNMGPPTRKPSSPSIIDLDDSIETSTSKVIDIDDSIQTASPDSSLPIRSGARRNASVRRKAFFADSSSPAKPDSPPPVSPTHSPMSSPEIGDPPRRRRFKRPKWDRPNDFIEMEAELSGEDVRGGSSDTEGEEDAYDRDFIKDSDLSQVDTSYDQSAVYRQGLQTQA